MMTYKIEIDKKAQKFIMKQPNDKKRLIYKAIFNLPYGDVRPLQGKKNMYRLRVGNYRIIYTVDNDKYVICVVRANNRGDVYKKTV